MVVEPRKHLSSLRKSEHGGPNHLELERLGLSPEKILDFSANINPYGPAPRVLEAIRKVALEKYPDRHTLALRKAVARNVGVEQEEVLPGNGVSELIWLAAFAYLSEFDSTLIVGPTFGEYADASLAAGAKVYHWVADSRSDFIPGVNEIIDAIGEVSPKLVFLCNPNNPTGTYLNFRDVQAILESWEEGMLVLDEAYCSFVDEAWPSLPLMENGRAIILRSLTKDCALAGLRLGYALARKEIIRILEKVQPPWSVNALAQTAGCVAMESVDHFKESLVKLRKARDYLVRFFAERGFRVVPSSAHYFMVEVGDAAAFRKELLLKAALVRDCTSFGLPAFIRVSPRSMEDCRRLAELISTVSGRWI